MRRGAVICWSNTWHHSLQGTVSVQTNLTRISLSLLLLRPAWRMPSKYAMLGLWWSLSAAAAEQKGSERSRGGRRTSLYSLDQDEEGDLFAHFTPLWRTHKFSACRTNFQWHVTSNDTHVPGTVLTCCYYSKRCQNVPFKNRREIKTSPHYYTLGCSTKRFRAEESRISRPSEPKWLREAPWQQRCSRSARTFCSANSPVLASTAQEKMYPRV